MAASKKSAKKVKSQLTKRVDLPGAKTKDPSKLHSDVKAPKPVVAGTGFVSSSFTELGKVVWPSRKESIRLTIAVILFSLFLTAFIAGLDWVFGEIVQRFIIGN